MEEINVFNEITVCRNEAEVETTYNYLNQQICPSWKTIKIMTTDGVITINNRYYGIQEIKFNQKVNLKSSKTSCRILAQLTQALRYIWQIGIANILNGKIQFINLASEQYYITVFPKDIEELIKDLWNEFPKWDRCPSRIWSVDKIRKIVKGHNLKFEIKEINKEFKLEPQIQNIFNHVA